MFPCENTCRLQGSFGSFGPEVRKKKSKVSSGDSPPQGPPKVENRVESTSCFNGYSFFAYNWKLPAYSGAFYLQLTILASLFTYSWSFLFFNCFLSFFSYSWSFFAYNGKVRQISALRDCKQRSLTVSKKAPTVSRKASPVFNPVLELFGALGREAPGTH